jgi:phosphatidylinositol dimannoside acyltransferase
VSDAGRPGRIQRIRERTVDAGFAAGWAAVKAVPHPVAAAAFQVAADAAAGRNGAGVRRLRTNLRRVVGSRLPEAELERLLRRAMRSYGRYWREVFRLPVIGPDTIRENTDAHGVDVLDNAIAAGRGVICALPHSGNLDAAGAWLVDHGSPFATVVERLRPESLYRRFVAYREGLGMEVVPLTGGERAPSDALAERLRAGGVVCLLGDRDLTRRGVDVRFFGETARMPPGPALLAATTGAALLPVALWFTPGGWGLRVHPPVTLSEGRLRDRVGAATQALADVYEAEIAERPEDWHMLQRLWVADLPAPARAPARPARPSATDAPAAPSPAAPTPAARAQAGDQDGGGPDSGPGRAAAPARPAGFEG